MLHKSLLIATLTLLVNCSESPDKIISVGSMSKAVYTGPALKLPLSAGYGWKVNTNPGFYSPVVRFHSGIYFHSIDFGDNVVVNGRLYDEGSDVIDVLAAADGIVSFVQKTDCSDTGNACRVFINHSGSSTRGVGYDTEYTHVVGSTITVNTGDTVKQGQKIAKLGRTGTGSPHLHFSLRHNNDASEDNPNLQGVMLENVAFANYRLDQRYPSTNGFTFDSVGGNNPHTCSDQPSGGTRENGWVYSCTRSTDFRSGFIGNIWTNLFLTNLQKDICFKTGLYLGDVEKTTTSEWCTDRIESDGGWNRAHIWVSYNIPNETGTTWNIRVFMRLKQNVDYLPVPLAVTSNFTITPHPVPFTPTLTSPISPDFPRSSTQVSNVNIPLTWYNFPFIINHNIYFYLWNGSSWDQSGPYTTYGGSPVYLNGVPSNTYCAWIVQACNGSGCSGWSDFGYFQTLP